MIASAQGRRWSGEKQIIAARIEQEEIDLGAGFFHLVEHAGKAGHLHEQVSLVGGVCIDRDEIVQPMGLEPWPA
jgi:hypothetical protein